MSRRVRTGVGHDMKAARGPHDGKSAKLGYDSNEPHGAFLPPKGTSGGDLSLRVSKNKAAGCGQGHVR